MNKELNRKEREELELYRDLIEPPKPEVKKTISQRINSFLASLIIFLVIVVLLHISWNNSLAVLFPAIPEATFTQFLGLVFMYIVLFKRSDY